MTLVAGCGGDTDETGVDRWFDITRDQLDRDPPSSDVMQIDPTAGCDLVDTVQVDGEPLELFGAGTARFGDIGGRYQCAWSGDAAMTANVRLEVVTIDDAADFDDYVELIPTRSGNVVVATNLGAVQVASFRPDPDLAPVTTTVLVNDERRGGVHLVVELLDPDVDFEPVDHAELLVRLAER